MELWNALTDNQIALVASTLAVLASFWTLSFMGRRTVASRPASTQFAGPQAAGTVSRETDARAA